MSKSKLEIYKENYTGLIDAFADMHNAHCRFINKPSSSKRVEMRRETMKVKKMVNSIMADISKVYHESIYNRRARVAAEKKKRSGESKFTTTNQPNGEHNVTKDI